MYMGNQITVNILGSIIYFMCYFKFVFYFIIITSQENMKLKLIVLLQVLIVLGTAIPYRDQIALLNSLEVGRKQDPMTWQCAGCDQNTKPIRSHVIQQPVKDVKAILSVYDEYTVLAFRYTATVKNVFQDILWAIQKQDQHACKGCKVQKQYDNMWNSIRNSTLDDLANASHTGRLVITGISLGGGLADISYVDIAKSGLFQDIEIVTFGAPRVGNKKWSKWFDEQTPSFRYFIKGDPIAVLPVCFTPICTYRQTGTPIKCNKKSTTCSASLKGEEQAYQFSSAAEHIQALMNIVEQHQNEDDNEHVGGIIDHIYGYKKIKDYDYVG